MTGHEDVILSSPLFLGPRGEGLDLLRDLILKILEDHRRYRQGQDAGPRDAAEAGREAAASSGELVLALDALLKRLHGTYPYFHPRYVAQMVKDPAIPAVLGYLAAMLMNPNNHSYEGGPATTDMEIEVVDRLLRFVGFASGGSTSGWGHLCSGGTLANLEALWAVRDTRADGAVLFSRVAHHSWGRNASVLRIPRVIEVETDACFRLDMNHLEEILKKERPMLVAANLGTTGTGSIDPIEDLLRLRDRYGFHLHVDAAYGGYARACLLAPGGELLPYESVYTRTGMSEYVYRQLAALGGADSITIDPHKHGLSPYGAGSILYRDPRLRRPLLNTAPYTFHVTDKPNLGMITLEGSRPGAAAAACWLTQRVVPLDASGYGAILGAGLRVAREMHARALGSAVARPLHAPDLDILCVVRWPEGCTPGRGPTLTEIDRATEAVHRRLSVTAPGRPPAIVSRFVVPADLASRALSVQAEGEESIAALRMVLMKHWLALPREECVLREMARAVFD
jgi:glutamate/tyrosine decarboxylase-like PLP-dependent enzyme